MNIAQIRERIDQYERLMRLDKPIGIQLLLWPTLWAVWIAADGRPGWQVIVIFTLGTVLMRSAGCVVNDLADMRFDGEVKRTRERPLVTGEVGRREALILAAVLALAAFSLVLFLNRLTVALSVAALAIACSYPFFKRFFAIPQAYLGIAFGFGIPMAFAAQCDTVPAVGWWMLLANIFWAVAYDTEYAMVDRDDDIRIGIRTAAITFGRYDVLAIMLCYGATLALLAAIGRVSGLGVWYFAGLAVAAGMMGYHYTLIRGRSREGSFRAFNHNNWVGGVIFIGLLADYWQRQGRIWN
ncbi:MAG: 4-hydroxybenzoate octaprenyltransferase [Betaproteobacteria bacterium]|nr:4-hydroxybenzoate octaprenyltransferase [Betaproteobacteria bacterium]